MSTNEQDKQIAILLNELADKELVRSHNSIRISYRQMLSYIDKIRKSAADDDIQDLFTTYGSMAKAFFTQFEFSLLAEIKKLKEIQSYAADAILCIDGLKSNGSANSVLGQIAPLLAENRDNAAIEYTGLMEKYPALLQGALDKLRDEWQRLNAFATANRALIEDPKLYRSLRAVVEVAAHSVGIEAERIVIVPGNMFALYFFKYKENLAVLTVPIYSVQSFWEWSIFWHELAGYKVRRLEKNTTIEAIRKRLTAFHDIYNVSDEVTRTKLIESITWNNPFCRQYITDVFRRKSPNLEDLGGFEHQFERMAVNLISSEPLQAYDQIRADGWSVDWFKELFEDAWSVLAMGRPFLELFDDILGRNSAPDHRHPPKETRLRVATELLNLVDPENAVAHNPEPVEIHTAKQILHFMALLRAAERHYPNPKAEASDQYRLLGQSIRDELFETVRARIQRAIKTWSNKFVVDDDPARKILNSTRNFLDALSDEALSDLLAKLDEYDAKLTKLGHQDPLKGRDYKDLVKLSFSEVDYHTGNDIALTAGGNPFWMDRTEWGNLPKGPFVSGLLNTEILVADETPDNWRVKTTDWNSAHKKPK